MLQTNDSFANWTLYILLKLFNIHIFRQKTLNSIKKSVLLSFYWLTLGIIFLTGTNRVNLFALGYLVGSFIFLWEGNEFYLREKVDIIKRWNILLSYNVFVICIKCLLQLVGCVFLPALQYNFCWLIQLFGIACLNKFKSESSYEINRGLFWYAINLYRNNCVPFLKNIYACRSLGRVKQSTVWCTAWWSRNGVGRHHVRLSHSSAKNILQLLLFPHSCG